MYEVALQVVNLTHSVETVLVSQLDNDQCPSPRTPLQVPFY